MNRRGVVAGLLGARAAFPGTVAAQVSTQGKQWSRHGYYASSVVRTRTLVKCASSIEKRKGKHVEVTHRCRELAGAGPGRVVKMTGYLYGPGYRVHDKCKGKAKTTGNVDRLLELSCSLKLPKEAR
ncbi:MAG: hypothetical protein IT337_00270 [Thermomicrobiales bacterium]|nr:hypothetical protein [Thermomicrobiales bacterium]